ncbi:MAG: hypothetical protein ACLRRU_05825 [Faecalibacterium sp.]
MSSQTNTLTEGPLAKQIFLVSLPLALSNLLVARFYGARHPKDVEKTVHSAAIISAVAGVVLLLIGLLGSLPCCGCCMAVVRAGEAAGKIHLTVTADDSVQKRLTILIREAEGGISKSR